MLLNKMVPLLLCLMAVVACTPSNLARQYCDARLDQPITAFVDIEAEPPTVHNEKSREQVGSELTQSGRIVAAGQALGATTVTFAQRTGIFAGPTVAGPGFVCSQPRVQVSLLLNAPVIAVAREFPPGSCRYRTVLAHEMQHVKAYSAHLLASQQVIADQVQQRYRARTYYFAVSTADLEQQMDADTKRWLVPLISAQLGLSQRSQEAIDTPSEYLRLTQACPDEPLPLTTAVARPEWGPPPHL